MLPPLPPSQRLVGHLEHPLDQTAKVRHIRPKSNIWQIKQVHHLKPKFNNAYIATKTDNNHHSRLSLFVRTKLTGG